MTGSRQRQFTDKLYSVDQVWQNHATDKLSEQILASDLARELRRIRELNPTLLKITVADMAGTVVAATDRPAH